MANVVIEGRVNRLQHNGADIFISHVDELIMANNFHLQHPSLVAKRPWTLDMLTTNKEAQAQLNKTTAIHHGSATIRLSE